MPELRSLEKWEDYCHGILPASHRWSASEGLCLSCARAYAEQEKASIQEQLNIEIDTLVAERDALLRAVEERDQEIIHQLWKRR